jgi:hypothetical protein
VSFFSYSRESYGSDSHSGIMYHNKTHEKLRNSNKLQFFKDYIKKRQKKKIVLHKHYHVLRALHHQEDHFSNEASVLEVRKLIIKSGTLVIPIPYLVLL